MKTFLKRITPTFVWEGLRHAYSFVRRLTLDIRDTATGNPIEWMRMLILVRFARPRYSMVSSPRLRFLYELSKRITAQRIEGSIVECGVYNGGSVALMAYAQKRAGQVRDVWLFDSFEGLPPPTENDGDYEREHYYPGWCGGTIEMVKEVFSRLGLPQECLHIVKGWFQETFPKRVSEVGPIALLHIDADWYESVKICLEELYPKVVSGGYVGLDDYGTFTGCKKALHEYLEHNNIRVTFETRDASGVYFRKP